MKRDLTQVHTKRATLGQIAHGRSGDKGNHSNIAIIANNMPVFVWLKLHLTVEIVTEFFRHLNCSRVERFLAENVMGLNFMLYDALAGGASQSLRTDTQGKSFAMALLQLELDIPVELLP